jgi:hypothetical protein
MANHRTNDDILSELNIIPAVEKIQNYRSKWVQHVRRKDRERQTAHLILKYQPCEIRSHGRTVRRFFDW